MSDTGPDKKGDREQESNGPRTTAEWVSLVVSLLLLAAVVGVILVLWIQDSGKPASFRIEKGTVLKVDSRYHLPFTVTNIGDATAANVIVEGHRAGSATDANPEDEISTTLFDFVPAHSKAEGVLVFEEEPSAARMRVTSFQPP